METKQIIIEYLNSNEAKISLNLKHFKTPKLLGHLYKDKKTFRSINRSFENLFHLFGFCGLGINSEILRRLKFTYIEIPYNNLILRTTKKHFLQHAIPSPYQSDRVDKQKILDVNNFIIPQESEEEQLQENLFSEAANG